MANIQQMMHIANSCPGYSPITSEVTSTIGACNSKSCTNCHNLKNDKCVVNLYDKVLTSLDQT